MLSPRLHNRDNSGSIKRLRFQFTEQAPETLEVPGAIKTVRRGREILVTVQEFSPAMLEEIQSRCGAKAEVQDVDLEEIFIELVG